MMVRYPKAVIMVFCKAPIPGQVKTRLIPPLTPEATVQLHCELTERTQQTATQNNLASLQLWCTPDSQHPFFLKLATTYRLELRQQCGQDLGERMHHAFQVALSQFDTAIVLGCDCPSITATDIEEALFYLHHHTECVVAPAEDGGYVLLGLRKANAELFTNIPWGTNQVWQLTQKILSRQQQDFKTLKLQWDVDTEADLTRYRATYKR